LSDCPRLRLAAHPSLRHCAPEIEAAAVRNDSEISRQPDEDHPPSVPCTANVSDTSEKTREIRDAFSFDELYSRRLEFDNAMLWAE
jgi:hypothetical protein